MATDYKQLYDEMFPKTASDATKQYFGQQQQNIDTAYTSGITSATASRDKSIAQAYKDYALATNRYGTNAAKVNNAGLGGNSGYSGVLQGYATMAKSNAHAVAGNTYSQNLQTLDANKQAAQTSLLGNYANMLSTDETNAYNKEQTALTNADAYLDAITSNMVTAGTTFDDTKKSEVENYLTSIYGLTPEKAKALVGMYADVYNNGNESGDTSGEVDITGENQTANQTATPTVENTQNKYQKIFANTMSNSQYEAGESVDDTISAEISSAALSANLGEVYQDSNGNMYIYTYVNKNGKWVAGWAKANAKNNKSAEPTTSRGE